MTKETIQNQIYKQICEEIHDDIKDSIPAGAKWRPYVWKEWNRRIHKLQIDESRFDPDMEFIKGAISTTLPG